TLRTAARYADGWNVPFISPADYARKVGILEHHCENASRDPAEITRSVNVGVAFSEDALKAQFGNISDFVRPGVLTGSVNEMIDRAGEYRDAGAELLILAMRAPFDTEGLDRFAAEVLPQLA
ncbi:MAG: LLM class flavin-dependent oxidoreductase, partial [Acidimicrobiia bacterium]